MPPIKYYYGKKTNFVGKTLFEILANLRNFGLGRMIIKHKEILDNPGTKSYYIVKKVEPILDESLERGVIHAEHICRGRRHPDLCIVDEETWHTDWQLVPRDEEHLWRFKDDEIVLHVPSPDPEKSEWMPVPPLMNEFLKRRQNVTMRARARLVNDVYNIPLPPPSDILCMHPKIKERQQ